MTLEEFKKVVEEVDYPNTWRYKYKNYITPVYTRNVDKDFYLIWFYNELVKTDAFTEEESDNDEDSVLHEEAQELGDNEQSEQAEVSPIEETSRDGADFQDTSSGSYNTNN